MSNSLVIIILTMSKYIVYVHTCSKYCITPPQDPMVWGTHGEGKKEKIQDYTCIRMYMSVIFKTPTMKRGMEKWDHSAVHGVCCIYPWGRQIILVSLTGLIFP